jgi:hypothetical protein
MRTLRVVPSKDFYIFALATTRIAIVDVATVSSKLSDKQKIGHVAFSDLCDSQVWRFCENTRKYFDTKKSIVSIL